MKKLTAAARGSVLVAGILTIGCANEVIVPGETSAMSSGDPGGAGGGDTTGGNGSGDTTGSNGNGDTTGSGTPSDCTGCTEPSDSTTCSCTRTCGASGVGDGVIKIACSPATDLQGKVKNQCVCEVQDKFSGVCFETNAGALCSFDMGCCAKYFSGK